MFGRFIGRASASSSDNVRSITSAAGRLLLVVDLGGIDEPSREDPCTGVLKVYPERLGVAVLLCKLLTWAMTRSSSSTKLVSGCGRVFSSLCGAGRTHCPSGSIVTCSTDWGVFVRMSLTYLRLVSMLWFVSQRGRVQNTLVYREMLKRSWIIAYGADPLWSLFLELQVGCRVKALDMTAL